MKPTLKCCIICKVRCSECKACVDGDKFVPLGPNACVKVVPKYYA